MDYDYLKSIVFDLLMTGRTKLSSTSQFKELKHNKDLVPSTNAQLETVLNSFERYRTASYDIQGLRDNGIDVLLKYEVDSESKFIGIQIKSYDDIKVSNWLTKLKAQIADVQNYHSSKQLTDFYVMFCTDGVEHIDQVRNATAELVRNSFMPIHVVSPEKALAFLKLSQPSIGAYLYRKLSDDDAVFRDARGCLDHLTLSQASIAIDGVVTLLFGDQQFYLESFEGSIFIADMIEKYPERMSHPDRFEDSDDDFDEEEDPREEEDVADEEIEPYDLQSDVMAIADDAFFNVDTHTGLLTLNIDSTLALVAIAYDAKARYGFTDLELKAYLLDSLVNPGTPEET